MENDTLLGYLVKPTCKRSIARYFFPSKAGGKPAWLDPVNLPLENELSCDRCGHLMTFLIQVYASRDDKEEAFHRIIYVFICAKCSDKCKVFRCQLPRSNSYYHFEPLKFTLNHESYKCEAECYAYDDAVNSKVCDRCGLPLFAGQKDEEFLKKLSDDLSTTKEHFFEKHRDCIVFNEFELLVDEERDLDTSDDEAGDLSYEKNLYERHIDEIKDNKELELDENEEQAFEAIMLRNTHKDHQFNCFTARTRKNPNHVVRYRYTGSPLWFSEYSKLNKVPRCPRCKGEMVFEFQIQPEIIYLMQLPSSVDFGTIVIYTCRQNCQLNADESATSYFCEFSFTQKDNS